MTLEPATGDDVVGRGATGPTTVPAVKSWLRITGESDDPALTDVVDAINVQVGRWCPLPPDGVDPYPADVVLGATMLAGRVYQRRNSPSGVAAFDDLTPVYVSRNDPDVAQLLGIGAWSPPRVG